MTRASKVDVVLINGDGFPRSCGGLISRASQQDFPRLEHDLKVPDLAVDHGSHAGRVWQMLEAVKLLAAH